MLRDANGDDADDAAVREARARALRDAGWTLAGWDPADASWVFERTDGARLPIAAESLPEAMRILLAQLDVRDARDADG